MALIQAFFLCVFQKLKGQKLKVFSKLKAENSRFFQKLKELEVLGGKFLKLKAKAYKTQRKEQFLHKKSVKKKTFRPKVAISVEKQMNWGQNGTFLLKVCEIFSKF